MLKSFSVSTRRRHTVLLALSMAVLAGCANVSPKTPEEAVRERANARWKAMGEADYDLAYTFTTPGYRAVVPVKTYRARLAKGSWFGGEAVGVKCPEPEKCIARVRIDYNHLGKKISTHVDETWLFEAGDWWIVQNL